MLGCWRRETKACGNNGKATNWRVLGSHGKIPFHHPCLEPVLEPLSKRGASTSSGHNNSLWVGAFSFSILYWCDREGYVKKVRDCDGRNICLLVLSSKLTLHHGKAGRVPPQLRLVSSPEIVSKWISLLGFPVCFFWPNVGHAPKLCVFKYANNNNNNNISFITK